MKLLDGDAINPFVPFELRLFVETAEEARLLHRVFAAVDLRALLITVGGPDGDLAKELGGSGDDSASAKIRKLIGEHL